MSQHCIFRSVSARVNNDAPISGGNRFARKADDNFLSEERPESDHCGPNDKCRLGGCRRSQIAKGGWNVARGKSPLPQCRLLVSVR